MTDQGPAVLALARRAELLEFLPTGTLARRTAGVVSPPPGAMLDLDIDTRVGVVRELQERFVVLAVVSLWARTNGGDKRPFARFLYRVNVRYSNAGDASDEGLLAFAQTNGMVHLWPYARAFIQSAATSMGLVPITLPFFRVAAPNGKPLQPTPAR